MVFKFLGSSIARKETDKHYRITIVQSCAISSSYKEQIDQYHLMKLAGYFIIVLILAFGYVS